MKTIRAEDIPADVSAREFLQSLDLSNGEIVYEQDGQLRVVFASPRWLEMRQKAKEQLFAVIDEIHRQNPSGNSDDLLQELEEMDHPERYAS